MRIAAIRIDKLGDAILTEPAIRALKNYRAEHLTLILSNYTYPLFKGYKYADEILALDPTKEGIQKLVNRLKDKEYDEVFVFTPRSKAYYLGTLLKAKRRYSLVYSSRVLAKVYWSFFYKFWIDPVDMAKPETYSRRPILHELQQNFKVLELVGIVPKDEDLELKIPITEEELEEGEEFWLPIDSPHLLVAVSDRIIDNEEVIRRIFLRLRKMGFRPVFSAHPSKADIIPPEIPKEQVLMTEDLRKFMSVLATADIVISPDSGPIHLASAFKKPVIGIYPSNNFDFRVNRWGPWRTYNRVIPFRGDLREDLNLLMMNLEAALKELNIKVYRPYLS